MSDERVPVVTVEFLGVARRRAGRATLEVSAATVGDAFAAAVRACPGLEGRHWLFSLGGAEFIADMRTQVAAGANLLVLGLDAGG